MNSLLAPLIGSIFCSIILGFAYGHTAGKQAGKAQLQEMAIQRNIAQYNPKTADFEFKRCPTDNTIILPN